MKRRDFVRACAAAASGAALPTASQAAALTARMYSRARLVNAHGDPIRAAALAPGRNYVFDYPFAATPCFLLRLHEPATSGIDLKTEAGSIYRWQGGAGPARDLVA